MSFVRRIIIFLVVLLPNFIGAITTNAQPHPSHDEVEILRASVSTMPDDDEKLYQLDILAEGFSDIDSVGKYTLQQLDLATQLGDTSYIIKSLDRMGWYYDMTGNHDRSLEYYSSLMIIQQRRGDLLGMGKAISGMGDAMLGIGDFQKGIEYKGRALNILKEYGGQEDIPMIYRAMGKACMDYTLYPMAMEYFNKALESDLSMQDEDASGNTRNIGRDYHFIARCKLEEGIYTDTASLLEVRDLIQKAMQYHDVSEDYIFKGLSCIHLSLVYASLVTITRNWNYADSSFHYYDLGKKTKAISGYKRYNECFEILQAIHMSLLGNRSDAIEILDNIDQRKDMPMEIKAMLSRVYYLIYYTDMNWKGLLKNFERAERIRKQIYITEFYAKVSKINLSARIEGQIYHDERLRQLSLDQFERESRFHKKFTGYAAVLIYFFLMLILVLGIEYIYNKVVNQRLKDHEQKLRAVNSQLQALYNETKEQSEEIESQTREMKRQRNKLSTYNFKMMVHLGIGQRMQSYVLPSADTVKYIMGDSFIMWRPLEEVSGDFYWCTEVNGYKIIAVADCTGHGIPGAFLSMLGVAMLNSIVPRMGHLTNAGKILDRLRERVEEIVKRGATNNDVHDGMDIALCLFDQQNHKLQYAGAYRPLWMVRNGVLTEYKGDKYPVAVDEDRKGKYTNYEISTAKGDMFYMFTDGITDQYGTGSKGKKTKFKPKRLREFTEQNFALEPSAQKTKLENTIDQWRGMEDQTDDMLVIGIREQ